MSSGFEEEFAAEEVLGVEVVVALEGGTLVGSASASVIVLSLVSEWAV